MQNLLQRTYRWLCFETSLYKPGTVVRHTQSVRLPACTIPADCTAGEAAAEVVLNGAAQMNRASRYLLWCLAEKAREEGKASLQKVVTWGSTDAAGPSLPLLQHALLDLASLHLAAGAVPAALGAIQV